MQRARFTKAIFVGRVCDGLDQSALVVATLSGELTVRITSLSEVAVQVNDLGMVTVVTASEGGDPWIVACCVTGKCHF